MSDKNKNGIYLLIAFLAGIAVASIVAFFMAKDWKTIYGDGVKKTSLPGPTETTQDTEEALPDATQDTEEALPDAA